jgi:diguanylate cyclase (GGDEF)-like protein
VSESHAGAWDLAAEALDETLRAGVAPSLERLGRLGQVGGLAALVEALGDEEALAGAAIAHAREREGVGLAPGEIVGELLALGRVLERHGLREGREAVDWCVLLLFERITAELGERARRDALTGVLNHKAFHALFAAEAARARRYRGRLALVLLDLDRFKEVNDTEGHAEGDRLLRATAATLSDSVRENDAVGRLGGDEFGVLLIQAEPWAVDAFLARMRSRLPEGLSTSAGAAYLSEVPGPAAELFALADRRLYEEKTRRAAA